MSDKPIIGISVGDLNGIGVEIIIKTFSQPDMLSMCTPVVLGSSKVISYHRKALKAEKFNFQVIHEIDKLVPQKVNVLNCWKDDVNIEFGKENTKVGKYAALSLETASKLLSESKIDALVTAPIHKASIQGEGFNFSGHTDFLEDRFKSKATMMLVSEEMRMALATVHIPLKDVSETITKDLIAEKLKSIHETLQQDFMIRKGKIAVLALNPHAGDKGVIGKEDSEIVQPAIQQAFESGIMAFGPYPADSFFGSQKYKKFDAILAMYHDQGLTAFKSLSFGGGVNFSAGLPIIRTSPDHGTGFDIAGKGEAQESSFREAVFLACDLIKNRTSNKKLIKNALKKQIKE
jgi:4-hydroxythreonine-4-phosphate dehydrogenase